MSWDDHDGPRTLVKTKAHEKPSLKEAINYAIDLIYKLNSELEKPYENPFYAIQNMEAELTLLKFRDNE